MQDNSQPDWYEILQVHPKAEPEVIKGAYKRLSHKYHPDHNQNPDENKRMKDINAAWEVLGNPNERAAYDARRQRRQEAAQREQEARWRAEEVKKAQEAQRRQEEILREQKAQRQREVDEKLRMQAEERQTAESVREYSATRYTVTSRVAVAEKEQTKEKPVLGIILVPLFAGGVAGGVSAALYALPLSGLLSCGIGLLHMLLIVIAGLLAAWHSGHVRSGAIAGAIWGVVVVISAFLRSGKDLSALSATSILAIALALFLGTLLGFVGGSFSQR